MTDPFGIKQAPSVGSKKGSSEKLKILAALAVFLLVLGGAASILVSQLAPEKPKKTVKHLKKPDLSKKPIKDLIAKRQKKPSKGSAHVPPSFKKVEKKLSKEPSILTQKNPFENEIINKTMTALVEKKVELLKPRIKAAVKKEIRGAYEKAVADLRKSLAVCQRKYKTCRTARPKHLKLRKIKRTKAQPVKVTYKRPPRKLKKVPTYIGVVEIGGVTYYQLSDSRLVLKDVFDAKVKKIKEYNKSVKSGKDGQDA